jgi:hypothetical protein
MRRLVFAALLLLGFCGVAEAACPAVLTDCPNMNANAGSFGGELKGPVKATGGTTLRGLSDRVADTLNVLDFGPGGAVVDRTGVSDTSAAIRAAVAAACAAAPVKSVFFPPGTYMMDTLVTIPANCHRLTIYGEPGTAIIKGTATNASNPMLFSATGIDHLRFIGLNFDGNSAVSTNIRGLIVIAAPMVGPEFDHDVFTNVRGTAIWAVGGGGLTGRNATILSFGDTTITLTAPVPGLKAGAYINGWIEADYYLTDVSGVTLTLSKPSDQTNFANSLFRFTPSFVTSADAFTGDLTLLTADTTGLAVGQVLEFPGSRCLVRGTRITAVATNASVTIDQTPVCKIPSGSAIASAAGIAELKITNSKFERIGDGLRTAGSATYTTSGTTAAGSKTITFNCVSTGCGRVGLIPGDLTAASGLPAGVPVNDLVIDGPVPNNTASTYTVTLKAPVTQTIAAGTPIPFAVGASSGNGYPLWYAFGGWFANTNSLIANNYFGHSWSSPLFFLNTQGLTLSHNTYRVDFQEFQLPTIAPSACIAAASSIDLTIDGDVCSGATGNGIEADNNINFKIINMSSTRNGTNGLFFCGGRNVQVVGGNFSNNAQWSKYPLAQQPDPNYASNGITLGGSCSYAQRGTISDVAFTNVSASDYQATPTQNHGVAQWNRNATINNLTFGQMSLVGNLGSPYDPLIDPNPPVPPPGTDNRLINPCAKLAQGTEGAAVIPGGNFYVTDGWLAAATPANVKYQRTNTPLTGCGTAITATVLTQYTPTATQFSRLEQGMQAADLVDLKVGKPDAKPLILDFCAVASTAGDYPWTVFNGFAPRPRSYAGIFTIVAPNVPQCYSFSFPGDTVQAFSQVATTFALFLFFDMGSGSNWQTSTCNSWVDGNALSCSSAIGLQTLPVGQTMTISSVRLYPAAVDSPWKPRTDSAELALAQEYYTKSFPQGTAPAQNAGITGAFCVQNKTPGDTPSFLWSFPQQMWKTPVITTYNPSAANEKWRDITTNTDVDVVVNGDNAGDTNSVLISAAGPVAGVDTLCIHAVANGRGI